MAALVHPENDAVNRARLSFMHNTIPFHYGWLIVIAGSLGIFACIGLARFALGMLLPAMGADLQLSYAQMGTISTANFIGLSRRNRGWRPPWCGGSARDV